MVDVSRAEGTSGPLPPEELWLMANQIARAKGLDPEMVYRMIMQESGGDPSAVNEAENAVGLMQVRPGAAEDVGADHAALAGSPWAQVDTGTDYLAHVGGDTPHQMLSRYNAGPTGAAMGRGQAYADEVLARPGRPPGIGDYAPGAPAITTAEMPRERPAIDAEAEQLAALGYPPYLHAGGGTGGPQDVADLPAAQDAGTMGVPNPSTPGGPGGALPAARDVSLDGAPPGAPGAPTPLDSPTPDAGAGGGGGLDGAEGAPPEGPRPVGARPGWKDALAQFALPLAGALSGGRANPMLSFAVGQAEGKGKRAISEWEQEQKVKLEQDKADMERAQSLYDELQGFDLNEMIAQADTPEKKAMLERAGEEIDKVAQKYADMMDPASEGGTTVTPNEARKFETEVNRARTFINKARTGQARVGMGLEAEGAVASERAKREAFPEMAETEAARARYYEARAQLAEAEAANPGLFRSSGMNIEDFARREDIRSLYDNRKLAMAEATADWNSPEGRKRAEQRVREIDQQVANIIMSAQGGGSRISAGAPIDNALDPLGVFKEG